MRFYFEGSERGFRGRPRETHVTTFIKDITRVRAMERPFPPLNMMKKGDFEKIRSTAKDRKQWRSQRFCLSCWAGPQISKDNNF